jgi:hypothetical protein
MDRSDVRNAWRDLDFWLEVKMKYLGCSIKKNTGGTLYMSGLAIHIMGWPLVQSGWTMGGTQMRFCHIIRNFVHNLLNLRMFYL